MLGTKVGSTQLLLIADLLCAEKNIQVLLSALPSESMKYPEGSPSYIESTSLTILHLKPEKISSYCSWTVSTQRKL